MADTQMCASCGALHGSHRYTCIRYEQNPGYYDRLMQQEKATVKEIAPDPVISIGGGPTRATSLPTDSVERKRYPIASGVLDYFPDAIAAVARVSWEGNEQHNPGQPLHWARGKSANHDDTLMRHFVQRGTLDTDGQRHSAKVAWRALAALQEEIERERTEEKGPEPSVARGCPYDTDGDGDCGRLGCPHCGGPKGKVLLMPGPKATAAFQKEQLGSWELPRHWRCTRSLGLQDCRELNPVGATHCNRCQKPYSVRHSEAA